MRRPNPLVILGLGSSVLVAIRWPEVSGNDLGRSLRPVGIRSGKHRDFAPYQEHTAEHLAEGWRFQKRHHMDYTDSSVLGK